MLARKKLGTRAPAVSLPSPLSDDRKIAFHSSSLGATASASEDSVIPVRMLHLSRSTISCDLRTASAGLPPVASARGWRGRGAGRPRRAAGAPAVSVLHLGPHLAAALQLLPDRTERSGQRQWHTDLDRFCRRHPPPPRHTPGC